MYRTIITVGLLVWIGAIAADAPPDWRMYAFTATKPTGAMFYLYSEIVRSPPGHVRVWMKSLDYATLEKLTEGDVDKDVMGRAVKRAAQSYVPPLATIDKNLSDYQLISIRVIEQIADTGSIPPTLRILYEFDCGQKMYRELSVIAQAQSSDGARPWKHVPPESTVETLWKQVCQ